VTFAASDKQCFSFSFHYFFSWDFLFLFLSHSYNTERLVSISILKTYRFYGRYHSIFRSLVAASTKPQPHPLSASTPASTITGLIVSLKLYHSLKERGHYCTSYTYVTVLIRNAANFVDLIFVSSTGIMILYQKIIRKASNKAKMA
jgi:hypothetical protein